MRGSTTLRRLASTASVTVALGALAAACGSSSASPASLIASASSHLESAKTYDVDISIKEPRSFLFMNKIDAEVDVPRHLALLTLPIGGVRLRVLITPSHSYFQGSNSTAWYILPSKDFSFTFGAVNSAIGHLLASVFHPKLDGHVVVSGQTCTLVTASTSLASLDKLLGGEGFDFSYSGTTSATPSATSAVHKAGKVTVDVAISPAGYPLRVVERFDDDHLHMVLTEDFSDFGAPLHITVPSPSHIKPISSAQIGELFSGLIIG